MGEERFAEFWTSPDDVESAFLNAFGVTLERWTMRWARAQIGVPRHGPYAPASSALVAAFVAGLFVAGAVLYVVRRQVR
jgi:hypothetical protein